jgi:hypothetical protein
MIGGANSADKLSVDVIQTGDMTSDVTPENVTRRWMVGVKVAKKTLNGTTTISYLSICEHKSVRHPFSRSDCKKLSRSTMAEATGPPPPLGSHSNGVDISHPNYAIDSVIWQEAPKQFSENHMNTASMTAKTSNDQVYKSIGNATTWNTYVLFGYRAYMITAFSLIPNWNECARTRQTLSSSSGKVIAISFPEA